MYVWGYLEVNKKKKKGDTFQVGTISPSVHEVIHTDRG
jgi:hypothetical protein